MKAIFLTLALFIAGMFFTSCTDTKDCLCTVDIPSKSEIKKAEKPTTVSDWDGDCSKIDGSEVEGWNGEPCTEI